MIKVTPKKHTRFSTDHFAELEKKMDNVNTDQRKKYIEKAYDKNIIELDIIKVRQKDLKEKIKSLTTIF